MLHHSAVATNTEASYRSETEVVQPTDPYAHLNYYQKKALATRARRQKKGMYKRPTKLQRAAMSKHLQSRRLYGEPVFNVEELEALATHPHLSDAQRAEFAERAKATSVNR